MISFCNTEGEIYEGVNQQVADLMAGESSEDEDDGQDKTGNPMDRNSGFNISEQCRARIPISLRHVFGDANTAELGASRHFSGHRQAHTLGNEGVRINRGHLKMHVTDGRVNVPDGTPPPNCEQTTVITCAQEWLGSVLVTG